MSHPTSVTAQRFNEIVQKIIAITNAKEITNTNNGVVAANGDGHE